MKARFTALFLTSVLLAQLCLGGCRNSEKLPEAASVENVFSAASSTLPEGLTTQSDVIFNFGDRIGLFCYDGYDPNAYFDSVIYSVDLKAENPETTVIPRQRADAPVKAYCPDSDGGCYIIDSDGKSAFLYHLSSDWAVLSSVDIYSLGANAYSYRITVGGGGNVYLAGDGKLFAFDADCALLYSTIYSGWLDALLTLSDGRVMLQFLDTQNSTVKQQYVDDASKSISGSVKSPKKLNASAYTVYPGGDGYDMYLTNTLGMYGYKAESGETVELCSWINSDIVAGDVSDILVFSPDMFAAHGYENSQSSHSESLSVMTRTPEDEVVPKYLITMQVNNISDQINRAAVAFNRQSDKWRVVVEDYSQYNTADDAFVALSKLDTDIISGEKIPDIFTVDDQFFDRYADKGLFCDLYTLMDSDDSFDRGDLLPCVLEPMETNGCLYQLARGFTLITVASSQSVASQYSPWTLDAMLDYADSLDNPIFVDYFRSNLLDFFFDYGIGNFVKDGACSFDDGRAARLIGLLDDYGENWYAQLSSDEKQMRLQSANGLYQGGEALLIANNIYMTSRFIEISVKFGGSDFAFIGFPSDSGGESYVHSTYSYAIADDSPVKAGAWEFLKFLLGESYIEYDPIPYGYPALKSAFEKRLDDEQENIYYYNPQSTSVTVTSESADNLDYLTEQGYTIVYFTDELREKLESLVNSVTQPRVSYPDVTDIIDEELDSYFGGAKTLDETVALIQNRASICISERS